MQGVSLFEGAYYGACAAAAAAADTGDAVINAVNLVLQYPMLNLETMMHDKSANQIQDDALRSWSKSVSDARYEKFYRAWRAGMRLLRSGQIAEGGAKLSALQKMMLDHYARELWCKLVKANPLTYDWNEIAIEYTSPVDLRYATEEERLQAEEFAKSRLQPFFDASIRDLGFDVP
jgi:hypothetical protein